MAAIIEYDGFDVAADCEALHEAMDGLGTNEDTITAVIAKRSTAQRQELKDNYAQMFGEDLVEQLKSELGGNYENAVLALFHPHIDYLATEMHEAISGAGTSDSVLIEILCSSNNEKIEAIKEKYKELFEAELVDDIDGDTSGNFGKLMFSLAQASRSEDDDVNDDDVATDVANLIEAGVETLGTDETRFNVILASRSYPHLSKVLEQYAEQVGQDITETIESEMSGDLKEGMLALIECGRNRPKYFAKRLHESMKGGGTDDSTLIRVMVSRSEIDLACVKEEFQSLYETELAQWIEDDCGGDYKRLMLAICEGNA